MKRRGFLKFLGMAAAVPVVAPLASEPMKAEPLPKEIFTGVPSSFPSSTACFTMLDFPCVVESNYVQMSESGEMPRYEGIVYGHNGNAIWRFDKVSGLHFQCHNCGAMMTFNREDFRIHGKTCNADLIAPMERA